MNEISNEVSRRTETKYLSETTESDVAAAIETEIEPNGAKVIQKFLKTTADKITDQSKHALSQATEAAKLTSQSYSALINDLLSSGLRVDYDYHLNITSYLPTSVECFPGTNACFLYATV